MSALEVIELDESKAGWLPYAPAVRVPGPAEYLFLSGAVTAGDDEYPDDIVEQVRSVMRRHTETLEANGLGWDDVVHVYEFLTDMRDTVPVHVTMAEFFGDSGWKPANTLLGVNSLARSGARFELDVIAARPGTGEPDFWMSGATAIPLYHMHPHIDEECVLPDDIAEQTRRVLTTFDEVLAFTGLTWGGVARCSLFLTDLRDQRAVEDAVRAHLGDATPPIVLVGINALSAPGARLELEVSAGPAAGRPGGTGPLVAGGRSAVLAPSGSRLVFLPGIVDPVPGTRAGLGPQVGGALDALDDALRGHGMTWRSVAKVLIHVVDPRDIAEIQDALRLRCGDWTPALTVIQADDLPMPHARVQFDVIAAG
jgi:enamine deaminase RidA (YjgF/YER057c/UK114 family)